MHVSALIFNYLQMALALQYWQTSGTADARESMTLIGQVVIRCVCGGKRQHISRCGR